MMLRSLAIVSFLFFLVSPAMAGNKETIARLAPSALVLVLDERGNALVSRNANKPFVPASVAKIATAWLALEVLGADHRFATKFYLDSNRILYVKGGGDPFLISEELALLAPQLLAKTGTKPFKGIVLDTSYYPADLRIPGVVANDRSYNALNSALAVNFNTIHATKKGNTVRSAEKQTPITPIAISQFRARGPNGRSRISLTQQDPKISALYAGELLAAFINLQGVEVAGKISIGSVPKGLAPAYVHRQSRALPTVLKAMLKSSNNYITNQIYLEIGAHELGGAVSLEKSNRVAKEILGKHGLSKTIQLVEGSGISRSNRFTAGGLAKLLHLFAPHADLLVKSDSGSMYKTGTLSTVSTLAGYAQTRKNGLVRFVISLPGNTGRLRFRLLKAIEREL